MTFKHELSEKLPEEILLTAEYLTFLAIIKKENIKSKSELEKYLEVEIKNCKEWLLKNRTSSTMNRWKKRYTEKLDFLQLIKKKILGYL